MSTRTPDHHPIKIDGQDGADVDGKSRDSSSSACTQFFTGWFTWLKDCLHATGAKSIKHDADEKTEEGKAYKKLMEDLAREPIEHPFSVIMWIIHVILLVIFIILVTTFASVHVIHRRWLLHVRIHRWVALLMVLVSGYPFIRFVTYVVSEPFVWVWKMKKYTLFFARHLKKSVDVTLWFALVLWVWYTWYRPQIVKDIQGASTLHIPVEEYKEEVKTVVKQITRFLMALTIGALIWTVKSAVFLKLLADLHYKELCDRIRQTILDFHGIQFIQTKGEWYFLTRVTENNNNKEVDHDNKTAIEMGSSKTAVTENNNNKDVDHDNKKEDEGLSFWMCVSRLKKQTAPIWILKRLSYTYMEHMRKNKPAILRRLENVDDDEKLMEEAKNMLGVALEGHRHVDDDITREDLGKYGLKGKEVDHVLELFTSKEDGKTRERITQDQFLRWAVLGVKNCLGLERTIESSKHIFWKLDVLMSACVVVITLVVWLLLSEIVNTGQMAILFAPFVSASFIFGESLKRSFDGIIFVFGMHPFDVGDRVIIENVEMKVSEMNIMTTIFIKYDSGVEAIYPNSELSTKSIINLDITPDQPDLIEFTVPIDTPQELIYDMEVKIKKTLDDDLTYTSNTAVAKKLISDTEVTLIVYFKYLVSYLSAETKAQHRSRIFCKIIKLRKEIQIAMESKKHENSSREEEVGILRFTIDVKVKLRKIEELIKNKIMWTLHSYNPSLKDGSQVLFTGINKRTITMDVRMKFPKVLLPDDKNKLKEQIEGAIENELPDQRDEKKVKVSWLSKPCWDDHSWISICA